MSKTNHHNQSQPTLPFDQIRGKTLAYEDKRKAFWTLVSISLLSLAFYVYAINATAHNIAVRQNLERQVAELNSDIGNLEFASIQLKNSVTMERAVELGFQEVKKPLYVSRTPSASSALTLNTER